MTAGDVEVIQGSTNSKLCVSFDGTDDYMQVNAHAAERVAANDTVGTYIADILMDNITGTFTVLGAGDDNVVEFIELNVEAGLLTCRCTDGTVAQFVTQADQVDFVANKWYRIGVVQAADGNGVVLYVNGKAVDSTNDTATDVDEWYNNCDGIDTFRIGAANKAGDASVTNDFAGLIGQVRYYSRALSAADMLDDYEGRTLVKAVEDASTYLRLNITWDNVLTDAGLGNDSATVVNQAYLHGYGSSWSRQIELKGYTNAADFMNTFVSPSGIATTLVVQGA